MQHILIVRQYYSVDMQHWELNTISTCGTCISGISILVNQQFIEGGVCNNFVLPNKEYLVYCTVRLQRNRIKPYEVYHYHNYIVICSSIFKIKNGIL